MLPTVLKLFLILVTWQHLGAELSPQRDVGYGTWRMRMQVHIQLGRHLSACVEIPGGKVQVPTMKPSILTGQLLFAK